MKKVATSISLDMGTIMRIDKYRGDHGGSFSGFMDIAANYYLDHNQTVANVSIKDSTPEPIEQPIEVTPNTKNNFNFDDID